MVFEAIERAARMRGLLLMSDGKGVLVLTRAGVARISTPLAAIVTAARRAGISPLLFAGGHGSTAEYAPLAGLAAPK